MESINQVSPLLNGQILNNAIPTHYNLTLRPGINKLEFTGHLDVKLDIKEPTYQISLNVERLDIYNVRLRDDSQATPIYFNSSDIMINPNTFVATFSFENLIYYTENLNLMLDFNGTIDTTGNFGFFRVSKDSSNSKEHHLLIGMPGSKSGRKVFPCFLGRKLYATYELHFELNKELTVVSNMDVKSSFKIDNDTKRVSFHTTPKMPTNGLFFAIGKLEFIERNTTERGSLKPIRCRIYTLPGYSQFAHHSLNATVKSLESLEEEFQYSLQLDKLDSVSIPSFSASGISFWGIIPYFQDYFITDNLSHSDVTKIDSVYIIAHEISHQWFGNLIAVKYLSEFWLNEGFATYFGLITSQKLYPEYDNIGRYGIKYLPILWKQDINSNIGSVREGKSLEKLFGSNADDIFYYKGAFVLSMLNNTLNSTIFTKKIREYIKQFQHKFVTTDDFFDIMLSNSKLNLFRNWIEKPGYPVINIKETKIVKPNTTQLNIEQHHFVQPNNNLWCMNLKFNFIDTHLDLSLETIHKIFKKKSLSADINQNYSYLIDSNLLSYFNVKYTMENLEKLSKFKLTSDQIIRLLLDGKNLIDNGPAPNHYLLPIFNLYKQIKDPLVCKLFITYFNDYFDKWSIFPRVESLLMQLKQNIYNHLYQIYGFEVKNNDSDLVTYIKSEVINNLIELGDNELKNKVGSIFNSTISNPIEHNESFLKTIFKASLQSENPFYYKKLIDLYDANNSSIKIPNLVILTSLAYTNHIYIKNVLDWYIRRDGSKYNLYDFLNEAPLRRKTQVKFWEYIDKNRKKFITILDDGDIPNDIVQDITSQIVEPELFNNITEYLKEFISKEIIEVNPYYKLSDQEQDMVKYLKDLK